MALRHGLGQAKNALFEYTYGEPSLSIRTIAIDLHGHVLTSPNGKSHFERRDGREGADAASPS
jgi:hypothetical protein